MNAPPSVDSDRFLIRGRLGEGGMGVVYRAYDLELEQEVALKTLPHKDPAQLYYLKQEFRTLAGLRHRNLVRHFDLIVGDERAFFTMEVVDGVDIVHHVRGSPSSDPSSSDVRTRPAVLSGALAAQGAATVAREAGGWSSEMEPRLRESACQLARGIEALHASGVIHRDVKPANVLVDTAGRVVLLDFGLSVRREWGDVDASNVVVGTPAYMAPEQLAREHVDLQADLYALGVVLFEALTGRVPYAGLLSEIARAHKRTSEGPDVGALVDGVPDDLRLLTAALLHPDPWRRPTAAQVVAELGGSPDPDAAPAGRASRSLIGRDDEIGALLVELRGLEKQGSARVVHVVGPSGIGKTALLERFCRLAELEDAIVLQGRCLAQETLPYKALDAVVDSAGRALVTEEPFELEPADAAAVLRLFPTLERVAWLSGLRHEAPSPDSRSPDEVRRAGTRALRRVLDQLVGRRRLVVWIDDLQWADIDSVPVLVELVRGSARTLLVLSSSSAVAEPPVQATVEALAEHAPLTTLVVEPLRDEDVRALYAEHAGASASDALEETLSTVAGNPFLALEVVEGWRHGRLHSAVAEHDLATLLAHRLDALPPGARGLLERIALSGRPVPRGLAPLLVDVDTDTATLFHALVESGLVRVVSLRERTHLTIAHDQIRAHLVDGLGPAALAEHHRRLAAFWSAVPDAAPGVLARHLSAAGQGEEVAPRAEEAAHRAFAALAFHHAASLFQLAADHDERRADDATFLRAWGEAVAASGRAAAAADLFERAARRSDDGAEDLQRAAELLIGAGHLDRGRTVLAAALAPAGLRLPRRSAAAAFHALRARSALAVKKLRVATDASPPSDTTLLRKVDLLWTVAACLGTFDALASFGFQTRHLLLAHEVQEPSRLARALAMEIIYVGSTGRKAARTRELEGLLDAARARLDDDEDLAFHAFARGYHRFLHGAFAASLEDFDEAEQRFAAAAGARWERNHTRNYRTIALDFLGRPGEMSERVDALAQEYKELDDRLSWAQLQLGAGYVVALWRDQPGLARSLVAESTAGWGGTTPTTLDYLAQVALTRVDLYEGDRGAAAARLSAARGRLRSMRTFQNVRMMLDWLEALCAPPAAVPGLAARLRKEGGGWALPLADVLDGWAAGAAGRPRLVEATQALEKRAMHLYAAAACALVARLDGSADALEPFRATGARRPEAFARLYGPG